MSAEHFIKPPDPDKPSKPYLEFPSSPCFRTLPAFGPRKFTFKKIRGTLHYFGPWSDPTSALAKYLEQSVFTFKDALHAGRMLRESSEGVTVHDLSNSS